MTEFVINDWLLSKECDALARDIFDEVMGEAAPDEDAEFHRETMMDRAHEVADGHEWVIYNYKALMLCAHCNTTQGEDFLSDTGFTWGRDSTIHDVATAIAYGEMRARIESELSDLIEHYEPADA